MTDMVYLIVVSHDAHGSKMETARAAGHRFYLESRTAAEAVRFCLDSGPDNRGQPCRIATVQRDQIPYDFMPMPSFTLLPRDYYFSAPPRKRTLQLPVPPFQELPTMVH